MPSLLGTYCHFCRKRAQTSPVSMKDKGKTQMYFLCETCTATYGFSSLSSSSTHTTKGATHAK